MQFTLGVVLGLGTADGCSIGAMSGGADAATGVCCCIIKKVVQCESRDDKRSELQLVQSYSDGPL